VSNQLAQLLDEKETRLLEEDLYSFFEDGWKVLNPNREVKLGWHVEAVCDHLQAVSEGQIRNLVINIPPRHLKSSITSVYWPAWAWIKDPQIRWLFLSYGKDLVLRDSQQTRQLMQSEWYQERWGDKFGFTSDQNVKSFYLNDKGGGRLTASFEADPTGEGGDVIVVDDPLRIEDANNRGALDRVNAVWDGVLATRLNDPKTGSRVIIMQRLHENDLTGHVLKEGGWTHLYLPAKYETKRKCVTFFPKDVDGEGRPTPEAQPFFWDPRTHEGELLHPDRFGPKEIAGLEKKGIQHFSSQQQQRPVPAGGSIFKEDWWQFYDKYPQDLDFLNDSCQSWDCSFKDTKDSSYVVGTVWARSGANIYLIYRYRKRMTFPETLRAIQATANMFPWAGPKYIEDKANGTAVIQTLFDKIPGIIPVTPVGGKEARAHAVSYLIEAGNVFLPNPVSHPWVTNEFIPEFTSFPRGDDDDQVDSATQALFHHFHLRPPYQLSLEEILEVGEKAPMMSDKPLVF
jgi:predicted phage terminase large subunit-like protein